MSAVEEQSEKPESINPLNVITELGKYLTTSVNYVLRQGLSADEVRRTVDAAITARAQPSKPVRVLPKPELLDKGINDMREKGAN